MAACGGAPGETASPAGAEQADFQAEPAAPTEFASPVPQGQSPLPTPTDMAEAQAGEQPTRSGPIEIVPPGQDPPEPVPLTGEVRQDLLDAVFDDLSERVDAGREAIAIEQAGAVVWRDGSLGCPQPGMMYTQALVPGYRIVLLVGDERFDYHASEGGTFVLCEAGLAEEGLPPGDGSGPLVDQ